MHASPAPPVTLPSPVAPLADVGNHVGNNAGNFPFRDRSDLGTELLSMPSHHPPRTLTITSPVPHPQVRNQLQASSTEKQLRQQTEAFLDQASAQLQEMTTLLERLEEYRHDLADFFCEDAATFKMESALEVRFVCVFVCLCVCFFFGGGREITHILCKIEDVSDDSRPRRMLTKERN